MPKISVLSSRYDAGRKTAFIHSLPKFRRWISTPLIDEIKISLIFLDGNWKLQAKSRMRYQIKHISFTFTWMSRFRRTIEQNDRKWSSDLFAPAGVQTLRAANWRIKLRTLFHCSYHQYSKSWLFWTLLF